MKKPSAHVMEGRDRFEQAPAPDTFFERGADIDARKALHKTLEYFPTPPWATRALLEQVPHIARSPGAVLDPVAGEGHMVTPLKQAGFTVYASDIYNHGRGYYTGDFADQAYVDLWVDCADELPNGMQAVFMNPPFASAEAFIRHGLRVAEDVFMIGRLSFLCSEGRYRLHAEHLQAAYLFCERPSMVLGRYDPEASGATEYAWFHFKRETSSDWPAPLLIHIPPGSRDRHMRKDDVRI